MGTIRLSESGTADPFAALGEVPLSPTGGAPQAGRRAPSEAGGPQISPLSPTPRGERTSNNGPRPSPINPTAQVKSPTGAPSPRSPALSLTVPTEPEPATFNAPPSPVSKAVFKPGFVSLNGRTAGPSILDENLALDKPIKPGKGGFTSIPSELKSTVDEADMVTCQTCGRRFNSKSYEKHAGACEKQAVQPKREIYSSMGARVKDTPTEKYVDPATYNQNNPPPLPIAVRRAESSWRAQREDMKRAMNQSRQAAREDGGL